MATIAAPRLLVDGRLTGPGWLRLDGDQVLEVDIGSPPAAPDVQLDEGVLAPGLIDLQLNGAFGHDFADAGPEQWRDVMARLPQTGVTSFVPTAITAPVDELAASVARFASLRPELDRMPGAQPIGFHLEGPFLAERRRGAHRAHLLVDPEPETIDQLLAAAAGHLLYITLAPERRWGLEAVKRLTTEGVRVAIGHSDATDEQVLAAADAGATLVTHLYNAQRPFHHRDPGVVGATFADNRLLPGLIVDNHHVAPAAVRAAFNAAPARTFLVTDAISALGMAPGEYQLGGERTLVRDGQPPLRADGTIAGSVVRLDEAVRNAIQLGIDPAVALTAATRRPADAIGRPDLGRLSQGARADLVWIDDEFHVRRTWVGGRPVDAPSAR